MTRQDILAFLDSYRKTDAADPLHKWIGTYNLHCAVLGFNACSNTSYQPLSQQPQPYQPQPYQPPVQRSPSWRQICSLLTPILVYPCYQLVNPDNSLTYGGEHAVGCIRNGIILAGGAGYLLSLPLPLIMLR
ncbi:MAG TPA: hypothetical protein VIP70_13530 [Nitrososphaeraceae archaeon]